MIISEKQREQLLEAAKPLIKWLNENCHPHCQVVVDIGSAELTEAIARAVTEEFIKD